MKSIMIVTGSLGAGGVEKVTTIIAEYYVRLNYKVTICCLLEGPDTVFIPLNDNIELMFFEDCNNQSKAKILMTGKWVRFLNKAFKEIKPNYVLAMTLKIGALCVLARKDMKIRVSFRETSDPKSIVRNTHFDRLLCIICRQIDGIIFQTEWEKSCYPEYMQRKGRVIPNPVSVDTTWSYNADNKIIVTMGRLNNIQKRHDILIKAFKEFSKNNADYKLIIYGDGPDKELDENMINELELQNDVVLAGAKKNVHSLIREADIFVMTSDFEGLSNALAEAMIMGIPCISSDWPGCDEIIKHKINGYIYSRQNIKELSTYMEIIANDDMEKQRLSKESKKLKSHFDPENVIVQYAEIIEGR